MTETPTPIQSTPVQEAPSEGLTQSSSYEIKDTDKIKRKINGKEVELSISDLLRSHGLDKTATQRLQEAAEEKKKIESLKNTLSKKDISVLKDAGWTDQDIMEKAANYLVQQADYENLTPQEKENLRIKEEYERLKKEKEDYENNKKETFLKSLMDKEAQITQKNVLSELKKESQNTWLDIDDPIILTNIVNTLKSSLEDHKYDMPVRDAIKLVEEKFEKKGKFKKEYAKRILKEMNLFESPDELDVFLDKGMKGIRQKSAEALKNSESPFSQTKTLLNSIETTSPTATKKRPEINFTPRMFFSK